MSGTVWAAVFDLDDTVYAYEGFVASGYRAVSAYLARTRGVAEGGVLETLWRQRACAPGRELQATCDVFAWDHDLVPTLLDVFRFHAPAIRLEPQASLLLGQLRQQGWRLGVLTNGDPVVQRAKVHALGVASLVDGVVYAEDAAPGGKPAARAFLAAAASLGSDPKHTVMVGDHLERDVLGARRAGLHAIHVASVAALDTVAELLDAVRSGSAGERPHRNHLGPVEVASVG